MLHYVLHAMCDGFNQAAAESKGTGFQAYSGA